MNVIFSFLSPRLSGSTSPGLRWPASHLPNSEEEKMKFSHKSTTNSHSLLEELYTRHSPALFAYLLHKTGSPENAEDVLVDVFVAALETSMFAELSEKEQVSWLWRVAHNKGVDAYRRSRVRQGLDLNLFVQLLKDQEHTPELLALRQEATTQLQNYLAKLSPLQQEAIRLRFAHGLRSSEIATVMGKRDGTVRSLLSRALNYLRTFYERDDL